MKAWMLAASAATSLLTCGVAAAQYRNARDAIDYRQAVFTVMGNHFGRIGAMVNDKTPFDAKTAQANAELVATLAKLPWSAFVDGSGTGDTGAKPEVRSQPDKFKADAPKLQDATAKLVEAARGGNPDAVKAAFGAAGETCKRCHDDFRRKH